MLLIIDIGIINTCVIDTCILVNCPTRWSLLLIFGFLYWSSSWRWQPHIGLCRLLWSLLRAGMAVLTHFFCKMYFLYISRIRKKKLDTFYSVLPPERAVFFRRGPWLPGSSELWCCRCYQLMMFVNQIWLASGRTTILTKHHNSGKVLSSVIN